jgi:hypothetical protein
MLHAKSKLGSDDGFAFLISGLPGAKSVEECKNFVKIVGNNGSYVKVARTWNPESLFLSKIGGEEEEIAIKGTGYSPRMVLELCKNHFCE